MSKRTANNLFILPSMPRFYQQLLTGIGTYEELGKRVVKAVKLHHSFRQVDKVRELSQILVNFPIKEYRLISQYYLLWCGCREKKYHARILETVIEQSQTYKTKALQSRAAYEIFSGNSAQALYFYTESFKTQPSVSEYIETVKAIAYVKAVEGSHQSALKDLESLIPILRHAEPFAHYDILNSLAVELGEAGRKEEARNVSRIVLASPFAPAYPEWQDTAEDLKPANRSFISVPQIECRHVKASPPATETEKQKPASVVSFPPLKEAPPPRKPERLTPREINELTASEKRELILTAIRTSPTLESDYDKMLVMVGLLKTGPTDKVLDLEDDALLDDLMVDWSNQIEPEELAAVLSALRDCDDSLRQRDIFDRMIRIAFEQTQLCGVTEEQWRLRFERRLPKK
jgi:hypothetical protein